ncbi:hypothetical protein F511_42931 [Dorcoceras hygrometricum]|uniref:Dystroglycan-like n=1 Tax=Dorcoceras hygrometricum TaxID=472368 RepID=A0A2Z7D7A1_9LAMI|nr:hypothetical protein F511_42931 [Dorcoceras hygrometricum]
MINRYSRRRRSVDGAGTKKFSRKLQIQQIRRGAKYGMSCDDISLDVITISSWLSADEAKRERSVSGALCILFVQEQRAIAAQVCIGSTQNFQYLTKQRLLIFFLILQITDQHTLLTFGNGIFILHQHSSCQFFESFLAMENPGMVSMFNALTASGLQGFLGCPTVIYEAALIDFFENALVRDGVVISTVAGKLVEISEELFAETFELPVECLTDLSEIPKDLIFDAKSIVSLSGEPVSTSGKKREMMIEFRLLCDILAKTISVKAGSLDALTQEKFLMMAAIICGVRINLSRICFNILKDMITPGTRQVKGYAIQISLLLENVPNLELGESSEFPSSKILTEKTVHRYNVLNEKVGIEEVGDVTQVKRAPAKREILEMVAVAQEAVPIQIIEPTPAAPVVEEPTAEHGDEKMAETTADAETVVENIKEPVVATTAEEMRTTFADDVDDIIQQALEKAAEVEHWFDLSYEVLVARHTERLVETASDLDDEGFLADTITGTDVGVQTESCQYDSFVEEPLGNRAVDCPIPSSGVEITIITLGKSISIPGVNEGGWYKAGLPKIPETDKGKAPLQERDPVKGNPVKEQILLTLVDIECLVKLREQVIDEVEKFFNFFSLKKLAILKIDESYFAKEELVLSWAETDSTRVSLNRKMYILTKYRELLIRKVLEARKLNFVPGEGSSATDLKIMEKLADFHMVVVEYMKEQEMAHDTSAMHFNETDTVVTSHFQPVVTTELSASLDDLRTFLSERLDTQTQDIRQIDDSQNNVLSKLHTLEQGLRDTLRQQEEALRNLIHSARQDGRTLSDVQTIRLNEFRKGVLAHGASVTADLMDVRKEVQKINAKVDTVAKSLDDVRKDIEATK